MDLLFPAFRRLIVRPMPSPPAEIRAWPSPPRSARDGGRNAMQPRAATDSNPFRLPRDADGSGASNLRPCSWRNPAFGCERSQTASIAPRPAIFPLAAESPALEIETRVPPYRRRTLLPCRPRRCVSKRRDPLPKSSKCWRARAPRWLQYAPRFRRRTSGRARDGNGSDHV
jgi:hypothetical protein